MSNPYFRQELLMDLDYKKLFEELLNVQLNNRDEQRVLCPFHDDKKPSLSVNIKKGLYHCFACGSKGNIFQLAKELGYKIDETGMLMPITATETQTNNSNSKKVVPLQPYTLDIYASEKRLNKDFLQKTFKLYDHIEKNCLVIPYFDEDGKLLFNKYRSHNKKMWYDKGVEIQPYGLWLLKDIPTDYIYFVEGESDTQTLWQNDIPAIGIPGANAITDDMLEYLYDFERWYIVIENDKGGETFLKNMFTVINDYFDEKIANTFVVLMSDIEKKDINDLWKVSKKRERFLRRLNTITSLSINIRVAYKTIVEKEEKMFDKNARTIAKDIYSRLQCLYDKEGVLWNYDQNLRVYRIVKNEDDFYKNIIIDYGINKTVKINQIANQLKTFISHQKPIPNVGWKWIHFNNTSVNFETLETKTFNSQEWFIENKIPFNYNPNQHDNNDKIDSLFSDWVEDPEKLYALIGYSFIRAYPENKIFILYGIGGNGKSTFLNLLTKILNGLNNELDQTASASLDDLLQDRFSFALLYGKLANLSGEMPYTRIMNSTRLKDLTGEQKITAQYKFGKQFEFFNYAKLIFATNKVPATQDTSDGWFRRIVIIEFKNLPDDKKRYDILSTLTKRDYEYIIYKSMLALNKYAKKRFKFSSIAEAKTKYLDLSNPLRYYIKNNCIITHDANDWIESGLLINKFKRWLSLTGQPTMSWKEINDEITELGLERGRAKDFSGKQVRVIFGIRWKSQETDNDEIPF